MRPASGTADTETTEELRAEVERLRRRVAELQQELVEREAWANRVVASAQEKTYWLERWQIDLNALMERPGASEARALVRLVRDIVRFVRRVRRRLLRPR